MLRQALLLALPLTFLLPTEARAELPPLTAVDIDTSLNGAGVVRTADLDRDGDDDIVVMAFFADEVVWYENTSGDASTWVKNTIETGFDYAYGLELADIDGDGDLDLLGTATSDDEIVWWENDLDGAATWPRTVIDPLDDPWSAATADIDGDGDLDVFGAGDIPNTLNWYENTAGDGSAWTTHTIDSGFGGANWAAVGDVDQDGTVDVLSTGYDSDEVAWYANTSGDGTTWVKTTIATSVDGAFAAQLADIDADGDLDAVFTADVGDEVLWAENTDGVGGSWATTVVDANADRASWVEAVDLDADGDLDLVGAAGNGDEVSVYENVGGSFTESVVLAIDGAWGTTPSDLDGDGDLDLATVAAYAQDVLYLRNDTIHSSSQGWTKTSTNYSGGDARHTTIADVDGDGTLDVIGGGNNGIKWNANTAGDATAWSLTTLDGADQYWATGAADLNGDGTMDVIGGNKDTGELLLFAHDGAGGFTPTTIGTGLGTQRDIDTADLDHDGDLDVVVAAGGNGVWAFFNDGGTWTSAQLGTGNGAFSVETVDLDQDGDTDVVAAFDAADRVTFYSNDGAGNFTESHIASAVDGARWVRAGDRDGDGDLDLVVPVNNDGVLLVFVNGTNWTSEVVDSGLPGGWFAEWFDMDLDGDLDIIASSSTAVNVYENTPSGWVKTEAQTGSNILHGDIGDIDGDGDIDAVIPHLSGTDGWFFYPNDRYQSATNATDVSPAGEQVGGAEVALHDILVTHLGRAGDSGIELSEIALEFLDDGGLPMTDADLSALVTQLDVRADGNGDGVCDNNDASVATVTDFSGISAGVLSLGVPSGQYTLVAEASASWCTWLTLDGATGTSGETQFTVVFLADDSALSDAVAGLSVTSVGDDATAVVNLNVDPVADAGGPYSGDEGGTVTLDGTGSSDADGSIVQYLWDCDGDGTYESSGTAPTCTFADDGVYAVPLVVTDDLGATATTTATVTIANLAPAVTVTVPGAVDEGDSQSWSAVATDVAADTVTVTWTVTEPSGTQVDSGTGSAFTTTFADSGLHTIAFTAADEDGGSTTTSDTTLVTNVAPTITSSPTTTLDEGVAWQYAPTASEPGSDTLVWSVSASAPGAMTLDTATGQLDWTPTYADGSSAAFTLTVDDGDGGSDVQSIALTITFTDSEPDGMPDGWESANGLDPTVDDSALDPDADGISNLDEYLGGSDPQTYDGPDVPVATTPVGGEEVADARPDLTWTNATDPNGDALTYDVELWADSAMTTLLDSTAGVAEDASGTTTWTPTVAVAENATAWWRVRAADAHVAGGWTDLEEFFVNETNEAPTEPTPLAPLEGDSVDSVTPELSWTEGTDVDQDALTYDIEVVDGTNTLVTSTTGLTDLTWTVDTDLTEDAWYSWEVRSVDPDGLTSDWTVGQAFFVDTTNSPPADVTWVTPTDGDDLVDLSPLLEVNHTTDPEDEAITYEVEIDGGTTSESLASATPLWDLADEGITLDEHVTYTLRARAVDNRGAASAWAEIQVFTRGPNDAPDAPALIAPEDDELWEGDTSVTFVIGHSADPEGDDVLYRIVVAADEALTDVRASIDTLAPSSGSEGTADQTSWTPAESFGTGLYYWGAVAVDVDGATSEASAVRTFSIEEPAVGDDDDSAGGDEPACGCESSLADGAPTSLWLLLLLVPTLRRRR